VANPVLGSNRVGDNASYEIKTNLASGADALTLHIWMRGDTGAMMMDLLTDTMTDHISRYPRGIPDNKHGHELMNRTAVLTEFGNTKHKLIGDLKTTNYVGNKYSYTLVYDLSGKTTEMFRQMGVDVSTNSDDFAFYYSDYYTGQWQELEQASVSVRNDPNSNGTTVTVANLTRDLPGALGAAFEVEENSTKNTGEDDDPLVIGRNDSGPDPSLFRGDQSTAGSGSCLLGNTAFPDEFIKLMRWGRDEVSRLGIGRFMVQLYYRGFGN
jgi:hypothetical protein